MVDYLFGLLLFAFGIGSRPSVLGEQSTPSAIPPQGQLKLMRPRFTSEEQEKFQKERKKQEANIKKITDERTRELKESFAEKKAARLEKDNVTREVLEAKVAAFKDAQKKQKVIALADKYQTTVTARITAMHTKLESMLALLDRITAASGALKTQGTNVSAIEADVAAAQAKVSSALSAVDALAESVPTSFSVSGEEEVKADVLAAIASAKTQMQEAHTAFAEAHAAVGKALADLESITDAVQVGLWPEK